MTETHKPKPRLMSVAEAGEETSLSTTLLMLMSKECQFPTLVQLGIRRVAFVRSEVEQWIQSKIDDSK